MHAVFESHIIVYIISLEQRATSVLKSSRWQIKLLKRLIHLHLQATKLANVLFTYELQRRLGQHGIQVGTCPIANPLGAADRGMVAMLMNFSNSMRPELYLALVGDRMRYPCRYYRETKNLCCFLPQRISPVVSDGVAGMRSRSRERVHSHLQGLQALHAPAPEVARTDAVCAAMGRRSCCGCSSQRPYMGSACISEG